MKAGQSSRETLGVINCAGGTFLSLMDLAHPRKEEEGNKKLNTSAHAHD